MTPLTDPATFVSGAPYETLADWRRTEPVHREETPDGSTVWFVLKHADVVEVARRSDVFSASEGGILIETLTSSQIDSMRNMLLAMDPPRHVDYRKPVAPHFSRTVIAGLEEQIRTICHSLIESVRDGEVEFVHDVTADLPTQVMGRLMGLPESDWAHIHSLAEANTSGGSGAAVEMGIYGFELAQRRRGAEPAADLTSIILGTEFAGRLMDDIEFASFFVQLVTAGNDTTKTMLSSGLLALLQHPDQLQLLREDRATIPGAVEEILRWANPLHYFARTALTGVELGNVVIDAGDKVAMYYTSANRDEEVFENAESFDVLRRPNPHLAFGIAEHFCLGVHLARLEGRIFFEELLGAFRTIDLAGQPVRVHSNLNNGYKQIPVHLSRST